MSLYSTRQVIRFFVPDISIHLENDLLVFYIYGRYSESKVYDDRKPGQHFVMRNKEIFVLYVDNLTTVGFFAQEVVLLSP